MSKCETHITWRGGVENQLQVDRLLLGDCLELLKTIPTKSVDLVLTDPPYNINLVPQRGTTSAIEGDNMSGEDFTAFLTDVFRECFRVLKDDRSLISFMGWQTVSSFERALLGAGYKIKSMPIWVKNNFGIGYYTRPQYEPMYLCFKGTPETPERPISDVLQYPKVNKQIHSCQKPVELLSKLISTFSKEGDVILDPFIGSGTTAVSAIKTGRHFVGMEIAPDCFQQASERVSAEISQIRLF